MLPVKEPGLPGFIGKRNPPFLESFFCENAFGRIARSKQKSNTAILPAFIRNGFLIN